MLPPNIQKVIECKVNCSWMNLLPQNIMSSQKFQETYLYVLKVSLPTLPLLPSHIYHEVLLPCLSRKCLHHGEFSLKLPWDLSRPHPLLPTMKYYHEDLSQRSITTLYQKAYKMQREIFAPSFKLTNIYFGNLCPAKMLTTPLYKLAN